MQRSDWLAISVNFREIINKTSERVKYGCERSDAIYERSDANCKQLVRNRNLKSALNKIEEP